MHTYPIHIAGLERQLPICRVTDDLYIGAFICFGDAELTVACARELLKLAPAESYDYLLTAEAKGIALIHEMARQSGAKKYFIARKGPKAYMPDPIHVEDHSITTAGTQKLFLGRDDADLIRGKRIVLMDDVISTGGSLKAMEDLVALAGGLLAQYQGSATIDMGRGAIVIGLAAVIIGEVLLDKVFRNFALKLLSAVIGAIIYYVVITVVLRLGLESTDLKLLTALVVAVFLAVPYWKGRYFTKPVRKEGAPHA